MTTEAAPSPTDGEAAPPTYRLGGIGHGAALRAIQRNTSHLDLPWGLGRAALPPPDHLAFYAGLATIAAIGIVDWPVVVVLATGHLLAENRHHRLLQDFGRALEEA